ncbi:hypothetical protein ACAW74_03765 [Fibrella sp. WM1]|uniref:hypothetical protein n=1 Tax=Fibrella musci TaxID=3242485 RepID=UPI0035225A7B
MKYVFALGLTVAVISPLAAQIQKGQSITSGTAGLSYSKQKSVVPSGIGTNTYGNRLQSFGVSTALNRAVFVKDGWALAYRINADYTRTTFDGEGGTLPPLATIKGNVYSFGAALGVRRYWAPTNLLLVYAGGGLSAGGQQGRITVERLSPPTEPETQIPVRGWAFSPVGEAGLLYRLTNRVALEATVRSEGFPISAGSAGLGLAILTGDANSTITNDPFEASQTKRGRWLLGASAKVSGNETTENGVNNKNSSATASVQAGQFVANNVLVGASIDYSASRSGSGDTPGAVTYSAGLNGFVRSYIGLNRLRPFVEGGVGYGFTKNPGSDVSQRYAALTLQGGLAYMLGERFIIQTTLGTLNGRYTWFPNTASLQSNSSVSVGATATTLSNFAIYYAL